MKRRKFISTLATLAVAGGTLKFSSRMLAAEAASPSGGVPGPRPPANPWKRQPATTREKVALAYPPSDGEQWLISAAFSESNPDRVIIGQDMGGVWFSPNAGRKWFTLPSEGLGTINIQSLAIDPLDERRWLAMCCGRNRGNRQGLYLTTDGGMTWKCVLPWKQGGETWSHCRRIDFAPSSKDKARGLATRWYAAWDSPTVRYEPSYRGISGLVMSDDGGTNWSVLRPLPEEQFGVRLYGLRVHPLDPERLYLWGEKGLFRLAAASTPGSPVELLSGSGGLPAAACLGHLYISPDGGTLIMPVQRHGIYKSVDGGTTWKVLYPWDHLLSAWVNEGHPDTIYALSGVTGLGEDQVRITHDGGTTWITDAKSEVMPGESTGMAWEAQVGGETKCFVYPDPRDPKKALALGRARWFRTEDGGRMWKPSNNYFAGNQFTPYSSPQIFDPTNPLRYMIPMLDVGILYTDDGGKTLLRRKLDRAALGMKQGSSKAGAIHPDPRKQTMLLCAGTYYTGLLVRSTDNGLTWQAVLKDYRRRPFIGFDAANPDHCYQCDERSRDAGATWERFPTLPKHCIITGISAAALDGQSVLYAVDMDKVGDVEGSYHQVWKSLDRGDTWQLAIQADFGLNAFGGRTIFRVHPRNPHVIYTRAPAGAPGLAREWDTTTPGRATHRDLPILDPASIRGKDMMLMNLAPDPVNPAVIYALVEGDVGMHVMMTTDQGATWQDITAGLTFCTERQGLEVHPLTGVVYIGSGAGMFVRKPPYTVPTAQNTWDILEHAFPNWEESHLFKTYAD